MPGQKEVKRLLPRLRARPRLTIAIGVGIAVALLLPGDHRAVTRFLLGWNMTVWLYLALVGVMMARADHDRLRRTALAQAEGAGTVLAAVVLAALCSMVGIIAELTAAKAPGVPHALPHVLFALATVVGAWLLLPTMFALTYASHYYRTTQGQGLQFAGSAAEHTPADYGVARVCRPRVSPRLSNSDTTSF